MTDNNDQTNKRRLTEQEKIYYQKRREIIDSCSPEYIAEAPFLFTDRIQVTQMLSRVELFKMVSDVPGAIIECGVHRGNSLMLYLHLSLLLESYARNRTIIGFDTFEGFRSISPDKDPSDINTKMYSDTDYDLLKKVIELNDIVRPLSHIPRCELVKGDITITVPEFVKQRPELGVAMLIIDVDLYEPTKVALEHFLPLMPKGGLVVLDEVCYRYYAGETVALKEVLNFNQIELKRLPFDSAVGYFRV